MTVCLSVLLFPLSGYGQPPNKQGLLSFCHIKSLTTFPEGNIKTLLHPFATKKQAVSQLVCSLSFLWLAVSHLGKVQG